MELIMKIEYHTTYLIVRDDKKYIDLLTIRETEKHPFKPHHHCNAHSANNLGDHIFWHRTVHGGMYEFKVSGTIVGVRKNLWDYSKPVGQRLTNEVKTEGFDSYYKAYRMQSKP